MTEPFVSHAFDHALDRTIDAPRAAVDHCWNAASDSLVAVSRALIARSLAA